MNADITIAQRVIPLYTGAIPNAIAGPDMESGTIDAITNVSRPTLTLFLPVKKKASRAAIIICPGGGYGSLVMNREGFLVAKEFNKRGIVAFVLKYRLPGDKMQERATGALQDALQAVKRVRLMAGELSLDTGKIGMMGFSAGGHLVSTAGTHFNSALIENENGINVRPDFMILVYPVISFSDSLVHKGSMQNLLGPSPAVTQLKEFSGELQVTAATPPTFLVHAADDIWVPAGNSISFYEALRKNAVRAELHVYAHGGHGFITYPSRKEWLGRCLNWMRLNNFVTE